MKRAAASERSKSIRRLQRLGAATTGVALAFGAAQAADVGNDKRVEAAHFHHVHLNVTDPNATIAYYEKFFGANRVRYRDRADAIFTEKSFILMDRVAAPPRDNFGTSLWHIGWAGVDGPSEFAWRTREGIGVQTPLTPLAENYYMYFWGPAHELIEVFTGSQNHRFEHVHLVSTDIEATLRWFEANLGVRRTGPTRVRTVSTTRVNTIRVDNVNLIVMQAPKPGEPVDPALPPKVDNFTPTDGHAVDHIAFSYRKIDPVFRRMRAAGVEIARPIRIDPKHGLRSFFVRAPDGLLVEVVEEKPVPEGIWN